MSENITFGKFGKIFQEKLAALLLIDRAFSLQIEEVLNPLYFEQKYLQKWAEIIFAYREKYEEQPTTEIMKTLVNNEIPKDDELIQKQINDFFVRAILSDKIKDAKELKDSRYIKEKSLDFCKKQILKSAMLESITLLNNSSFDDISKVINDALKLGIDPNVGHDYLRDFEERYKIENRRAIQTGWPIIDNLTQGGLGRGELGVVIAPTGIGKSFFMVHWGAQAVKAGKKVVYFTLELGYNSVGRRFDSCTTGIALEKLQENKAKVLEEVKALSGHLIIKEYPTKSASVNTFRAFLQKLQRSRDFVPDLIIVDYADLMKPVRKYNEKRNELETIYEDLRALGQETDAGLLTATQTNRGGFDVEVIEIDRVAEAWSKCFVADLILTLSRTGEDKQSNTGRINVAKNRNGPDGLVYPIFMDTSTASIRVLKPEQADPSEKGTVEKYKEFLKEKKKQKESQK